MTTDRIDVKNEKANKSANKTDECVRKRMNDLLKKARNDYEQTFSLRLCIDCAVYTA